MPNRRSPRRPTGAATRLVAETAFPGGLSGASPVPAPSAEAQAARTSRPRIGFGKVEKQWDVSGPGTVELPHIPKTGSVEVYQCRPRYGPMLFQDIHWVMSDISTVSLKSGVQKGDWIIVHYAFTVSV